MGYQNWEDASCSDILFCCCAKEWWGSFFFMKRCPMFMCAIYYEMKQGREWSYWTSSSQLRATFCSVFTDEIVLIAFHHAPRCGDASLVAHIACIPYRRRIREGRDRCMWYNSRLGNSPLSNKVPKQQYKWCVMSSQFELTKSTELLILMQGSFPTPVITLKFYKLGIY
jgi:hypothetical protein